MNDREEHPPGIDKHKWQCAIQLLIATLRASSAIIYHVDVVFTGPEGGGIIRTSVDDEESDDDED